MKRHEYINGTEKKTQGPNPQVTVNWLLTKVPKNPTVQGKCSQKLDN